MPDASQWSPFGAWSDRLPVQSEQATLAALPALRVWLLQADPESAAWRDAADEIGLSPEQRVGAVARGDGKRLITTGPDAWLLTTAPDAMDLKPLPDVAAVEITEARVWLRLEGPGAAAALAKVVALDLRADAFAVGDAFGAKLGPLSCLIDRIASDAFEISGHTSSAEFLAGLLAETLT